MVAHRNTELPLSVLSDRKKIGLVTKHPSIKGNQLRPALRFLVKLGLPKKKTCIL